MRKAGRAILNVVAGVVAVTVGALTGCLWKSDAPTIQVLAPDLWQAFNDNESSATQRYQDANLVVSGEIAIVGGAMRHGVMYLVGAGKGLDTTVHVQLQSSDLDKTTEMRAGNKVLISCKGCSKVFGSPNLSACKVVKFWQ